MDLKINPVTITSEALNEIKNILNKKNIPVNYGLRIGIKGTSACAGLGYLVGFDQKGEHDNEFDIDGVKMYIDKRHTMYLMGVTLDFYDGADARGFKFLPKHQTNEDISK